MVRRSSRRASKATEEYYLYSDQRGKYWNANDDSCGRDPETWPEWATGIKVLSRAARTQVPPVTESMEPRELVEPVSERPGDRLTGRPRASPSSSSVTSALTDLPDSTGSSSPNSPAARHTAQNARPQLMWTTEMHWALDALVNDASLETARRHEGNDNRLLIFQTLFEQRYLDAGFDIDALPDFEHLSTVARSLAGPENSLEGSRPVPEYWRAILSDPFMFTPIEVVERMRWLRRVKSTKFDLGFRG